MNEILGNKDWIWIEEGVIIILGVIMLILCVIEK